MANFEYRWTGDEDGNIQHIAEHGLTPDDFEFVFENFEEETISNASGLPVRFGYTEDLRFILIVFEWIEKDLVVLPITADEVPERNG